MTKYYNWFYFLPMLFFTVFSAVALYLNVSTMRNEYEFYVSNVLVAGFFLLVNAVIWIVALRMRKKVPYPILAEAFVLDDEGRGKYSFAEVFEFKNDKLKSRIGRYDPKCST